MKNKKLLFLPLMLCLALASNNCRKSQEKTETERTGEVPAISGGVIRLDVNAGAEGCPEKGFYEFENGNVSMKLVPLETNDEFLCAAGQVEAFTDNIIIYRNSGNDEILIFDGQGKALRKLRKGPSGKEYKIAFGVVYDDRSKELFVNDTYSYRVKVYGLDGEFKRALPYPSDPKISVYNEMLNYDNESLICYTNDNIENPVFLISKQTGEKLQDIIIPYEKRISVEYVFPDGRLLGVPWRALSKTPDGVIISEPSSDTIYHLSSENRVLRPILCRTPSIQTMNVPVFITPYNKSIIESMWIVLILRKDENFFGGFLLHDYKNGKIYKLARRSGLPIRNYNPAQFVLHETRDNVFLFPTLADDLKEEDRLTRDEKEIISRLEFDDNPVVAIFTIQK